MKPILIALVAMFMAFVVQMYGWEPAPEFVAYIKEVEGFRAEPYRCSAGHMTIGYGHQIKRNEVFSALSEGEATALLMSDLKTAYFFVCKQTGQELYGKKAEMLVDYQFNLGTLRKFPRFVEYVCADNMVGMCQEFRRFASGHELVGRNNAFKKRYLQFSK